MRASSSGAQRELPACDHATKGGSCLGQWALQAELLSYLGIGLEQDLQDVSLSRLDLRVLGLGEPPQELVTGHRRH